MESINNKNLTKLAKDNIYKYIKKIDCNKNNKLPSEEALCSILNVSRVTVRAALNELASEGFIFRKHGKGTFINIEALKIKVQLSPMKSYTEIIKNSGYESFIKNIEYSIEKLTDPIIAEKLQIQLNDKIVITKKTFYANEIPCAHCVDYFPVSILKDEESCESIKKYQESIFEFFKIECNKKIVWEKSEISTTTTLETPKLKEIFNCNKEVKSFFLISGINYDEDNIPTVYAKEYVNTNIINFSLIRQRSY